MNTRYVSRLLFMAIFFMFSSLLNAQEQKNVTDANGLKQGVWEKKNEAGKLVYTGAFKDGKPEGEFVYYDSTGKIKAKSVYTENGTNAFTVIYRNDKKASEGLYINEKKQGIWKFYNNDQVLLAEEVYENGVPEGIWKTYYANGAILEEMPYKNGVKEGNWKQYFYDGPIKTNGTYIKGKLEGLTTFYYPDGKIFISGPYVNNLKDGVWMHLDEKGVAEKREIWKSGFLVAEEFYNKEQERMIKEEK